MRIALATAMLPGLALAQEQLAGVDAPVFASRFGAADSEWFTIGTGAAWNLDDATDSNLHAAYSIFLAEGVEASFELALWYASQDGDDAIGLNPAMVLRHHFYREGDWTLYLDAGIGAVVFSDKVPEDGTAFNLTPRAGVGVTYALRGDLRLQAGVRWHHFSNARIDGEEKNPARDGPMLYAGLVWAW